jgi:hypothetical protein
MLEQLTKLDVVDVEPLFIYFGSYMMFRTFYFKFGVSSLVLYIHLIKFQILLVNFWNLDENLFGRVPNIIFPTKHVILHSFILL